MNGDQSAKRNSSKIITKPDSSLHRYRIDGNFKSSSKQSRNVQFEQIDNEIYKKEAKLSGFLTSEERIVHWLNVFSHRYFQQLAGTNDFFVTWEDVSTSDEDKSDKVIITIIYKKHKLINITVFLTTGRIQIQGYYHMFWVEKEFNNILNAVDVLVKQNNQELTIGTEVIQELCSRNLDEFKHYFLEFVTSETQDSTKAKVDLDMIPQDNQVTQVSTISNDDLDVQDNQTQFSTNSHTTETETSTNQSSQIPTLNIQDAPQSLTPSRQNALHNIKEVLADVESRFVNFKTEIEDTINTMQHDLEHIKDKLVKSENSHKSTFLLQNNKIEDIRQENDSLKDEIIKLQSWNKRLQKNYSDLLAKQQTIISDITLIQEKMVNSTSDDNTQDTQEQMITTSIPCFNTFAALENTTNDHSDSTSSTPEFNESEENTSSSPKPIEVGNSPATVHAENIPQTQDHTHTGNRNKSEQTENIKQSRHQKENTENQRPASKPMILFLCDSNGKFLDLNELYPDAYIKYIKCPTLSHAYDILREYKTDVHLTKILIHTGTNDLEHYSPEEVSLKASELLKNTSMKFKHSDVIFSLLLPRMDDLNISSSITNDTISKNCSHFFNVSLIDHSRISKESMFYDYKHLNKVYGVKLFAQNIKRSLYGNKKSSMQSKFHGSSHVQHIVSSHIGTPHIRQKRTITQSRLPVNSSPSFADAVKNFNYVNEPHHNQPGNKQLTQTSTQFDVDIKQLLVQLLHKLDGKF